MNSPTGYVKEVEGHPTQSLHWNYCAYIEDSATIEEAYAYIAVT